MNVFCLVLQVIIAVGLVNVWLLRFSKATPYRGGTAESMREEFAVYGLAPFMMYSVGGLKLAIAASMIAGIWLPLLVLPSAAILILLMLGAFSMHLKVKDPLVKAVPSLLMLAMAIAVAIHYATFSR